MLNQCNFIGNLTADPETRYTQAGTAVCNFTLAVNYGWGDNEQTEFVRVVCWGKTAEACGKYLTKGNKSFVSGEMQTRKWQDQNGNDRYTTEITARNVQFLSPKNIEGGSGNNGGGGQQQGGGYNNKQGGNQYNQGNQNSHGAGSDVPF